MHSPFHPIFFSVIVLLLCFDFVSALSPKDAESLFAKGIVADLREPEYSEGVLTTECGGVVTGPDIRIQAQKIVYTRKVVEGVPILTIEAEGDLMLEFGEYVFVGSRLEYDFQTKTGVVYDGRTSVPPWYFGGAAIYLLEDGNYYIQEGFITTSESRENDWQIETKEATLCNEQFLRARHVKFRFLGVPLFWLPSFSADLDSIFDSPIRYSLRWGGRQGTRFGMLYEIFSWRRLKTFMRLDYRINRGLGIGFETYVHSEDRKEQFETINYIAQDSSIVHPHERIRYRFQGIYNNLLCDDCLSLNLSWDKLSDEDMPTDYNDRGLELDTAGRTQLHVRYEDEAWVSNFLARVRINSFQTVLQELPTLETQWLPLNLGYTGIISDTKASTSYLDFKYANGLVDVHDYSSSRLELRQKFYRPFYFNYFTLTPQAGGLAIFYGNSPSGNERWAALGQFGANLTTRLHRYFGECHKHVLAPYLNYTYYTFPTSSPDEHFIFDINDGWYRLNTMLIGLQQNFYHKNARGCVNRYLFADIFAYSFFDTKTVHAAVPKIYGKVIFHTLPILRHRIETAWDIQRNKLDHLNCAVGWTLSSDMAIALEYRHRDAYDWRKVDKFNFILDSFRPVHELIHSSLSDRRDTLLMHFFYRFLPNWAFQFESRQGWNRRFEPKYTEFELDVLTTLRSAWKLKLYYRHRVDDDRFAINISVGLSRPDWVSCEEIIPCLEF